MYTDEEFEGWKAHPTTKALMEYLRQSVDIAIEDLASGWTLSPENAHQTQASTSKVLGRIEGFKEALAFCEQNWAEAPSAETEKEVIHGGY